MEAVLILIFLAVVLWALYQSGRNSAQAEFDEAAAEAERRREDPAARKESEIRNAAIVAAKATAAPQAKRYPVAIVGEKNYQRAIAALREGDAVKLFHEPDNPYDENAVAVTARGKTIGYLARGNWLRDALVFENKHCTASILGLSKGELYTGVTLDVVLEGEPVEQRAFGRS